MTNKKPAVKAKSTRLGRPLGSKNKPKALEKEIAHWKAEPRKPSVNFEDLCQRLQNALAKSYVEAQDLEKDVENLDKHINLQNYQLTIKQKRIDELEFLLAGAVLEGDFKFDNDEDITV